MDNDYSLNLLLAMTPEAVDIAQVDDMKSERGLVQAFAELQAISYVGFATLRELAEALEQGQNAKVWIVDGSFPEDDGKSLAFNAPKAIELIQRKYADATIILYSSDDHFEIAEKLGVIFKKKGAPSPDALVEEIAEMIERG